MGRLESFFFNVETDDDSDSDHCRCNSHRVFVIHQTSHSKAVLTKRRLIAMTNAVPQFGDQVPDVDYVLRPGGYLVVRNSQNEIAILSTPKGFFLPGGGQNPDELPVQAAIREAKEECGLHVEVQRLIGTADELVFAASEGTYYRKRSSFFSARLIGTSDECEDDHRLMWMTSTEAINQLSHRSQVWAVDQDRASTDYADYTARLGLN